MQANIPFRASAVGCIFDLYELSNEKRTEVAGLNLSDGIAFDYPARYFDDSRGAAFVAFSQ